MERTRFQQVDVTPCSNRQEGTEAFMVGALLYIVQAGDSRLPAGRPATPASRNEPKGLSGILPYY